MLNYNAFSFYSVKYLGLLLPLLSRESPMRISALLSRSGSESELTILTENTVCFAHVKSPPGDVVIACLSAGSFFWVAVTISIYGVICKP